MRLTINGTTGKIYLTSFVLEFSLAATGTNTYLCIVRTYAGTEVGRIYCALSSGTTPYYLGPETNRAVLVEANTAGYVRLKFEGNFDTGAGVLLESGSTLGIAYLHIYPDRIWGELLAVSVNGITIGTANRVFGFIGTSLTGVSTVYNWDGSTEDASTSYISNGIGGVYYLAVLSDQIDVVSVQVHGTFSANATTINAASDIGPNPRSSVLNPGVTCRLVCLLHFGSADLAERMRIAQDVDDYQLAPVQGEAVGEAGSEFIQSVYNYVVDRTLPENVHGSAQNQYSRDHSGAFVGVADHALQAGIDAMAWLLDIERDKPSFSILQWPTMTGDVAAPVQCCLVDYRFEEPSSATAWKDSMGNGDADFLSYITGAAVATNLSGYATFGSLGGAVDTQETTLLSLPAAVLGNAYLRKGTVRMMVFPQYIYNDTTPSFNKSLFRVYDSVSGDGVHLYGQYDSGTTKHYLKATVIWEGTNVTIAAGVGWDKNRISRRPMVIDFWWDHDLDRFGIVLDGKTYDLGSNTGSPTSNAPTHVYAFSNWNRTLAADAICSQLTCFSVALVPYGALRTSFANIFDWSASDAAILIYWDCASATVQIGGTTATVTGGSYTPGVHGDGYLSDAAGERADIAASTGAGNVDTAGMRIGFWYKRTVSLSGSRAQLFSHTSAAGAFECYADVAGGTVVVGINGTTFTATRSAMKSDPFDGLAHHVEIVADATIGYRALIVDGWIEATSFSAFTMPALASGSLRIGDATYHAFGWIDELYLASAQAQQMPTAAGEPLIYPLVKTT